MSYTFKGLGTSTNPRAYNLEPEMMAKWQNAVSGRSRIPRLPSQLMKKLLKRLRKWTWYRVIGGEEYFLLYRALPPREKKLYLDYRAVTPGSTISFQHRTSFTVDAGIAVRYNQKYGSPYIEVWVPASAIVTSPIMYDPTSEHSSPFTWDELEIIVDPFTGIFQSGLLPFYWKKVRETDKVKALIFGPYRSVLMTKNFVYERDNRGPKYIRVRPPTSDARIDK